MADEDRIRLIARLAGDLTAALPYLNATMPNASFSPGSLTLTFMDGHRMVTLSARRIALGKADDLVDGWRTLENIRVLVNQTWARRASIVPLFELRAKPPALEIYKRLPRTNCKACGEDAWPLPGGCGKARRTRLSARPSSRTSTPRCGRRCWRSARGWRFRIDRNNRPEISRQMYNQWWLEQPGLAPARG